MLLRLPTCRIDTERRQIVRDGADRHLPRKPFDLLLALIEARPNVVTKDALIASVWPDTFVSDANLAVLVGDIRAAIGDSARQPRLIKTHHGVGYSFIGDVLEVARAPVPAAGGLVFVLTVAARRIELADGTFSVGRDQTCDVVLRHRSVSRVHARLTVAGETLIVDDGGSKNGTRINGVRLKGRAAAGDGDTIRFGSVATTVSVERFSSRSTLTVRDED
jgi:DNA-binding winged helix-turn-helix (wHTH) protein